MNRRLIRIPLFYIRGRMMTGKQLNKSTMRYIVKKIKKDDQKDDKKLRENYHIGNNIRYRKLLRKYFKEKLELLSRI